MARTTGNFIFTKNYENINAYPLDARSITENLADLNDGVSIPYPYSGMLVTVYADSASTSNNGTYMCSNVGTVINDNILYSQGSTWTKIGGKSITGGTYVASAGTLSFSGANNDGFNVDGTFDGYGLKELYLDPINLILSATTRNNEVFTANTTPLTVDNYVTGGTYNITAGTIFFTALSGTGFTVTGITTGLTTTTGTTYFPSEGKLYSYRTGNLPALTADGFNYLTEIDISPTNTISGYTNISGGTAAFGGTITAVTGGTYDNGNLYLSGTGVISTGVTITGFSTSVSSGGLYVSGTSSAGTGGTTSISGTSILSGQTSGYSIDLSGAFTFTNTNNTTRGVGGIPVGSDIFSTGKTIHQILQEIFYPVDAPTITNSSVNLTNNAGNYRIIGEVINVGLSATYTSGTSVALGQSTVSTGAMSAFTYGGGGVSTAPVTTSNNSDATTDLAYEVVESTNQWSCVFVYNVGGTPVDTAGNPYISLSTTQFTNPSPLTSTTSFEGVYPISATSASLSFLTQQTLVSASANSVIIPLVAETDGALKQRFITPANMGPVNSINLPDPYGAFTSDNKLSQFTISTTNVNVNPNAINVLYNTYTYSGGVRQGLDIRVNFS